MKKLAWLTICSTVLLLRLTLYAQPSTAVIPFAARGIAEREAVILSDRFSAELAKTDQFRIIRRELTFRILTEQGVKQAETISDSNAVQIGKLLAAKQVISGSISKLGNTYTLSARLISVETGVVLRVATYNHSGRKEDLPSFGMKHLAWEIANRMGPIHRI